MAFFNSTGKLPGQRCTAAVSPSGSVLRGVSRIMRDENGGGVLVSTPFFAILFMMLCTMALNIGLWVQKKQHMQMIADAATRAATLAIDRQYPVLEDNGKYHVYSILNKSEAISNAEAVYRENLRDFYGAEPGNVVYQPVGSEYTAPEWSSGAHAYRRVALSEELQYYNGDFTMVIKDTSIPNMWGGLLGLGPDVKFDTYSQAMASGTGERG